MQARIVIFAKAPVPGKVKTRLVPALGEHGAAELAQHMLNETVKQALDVPAASVEVCVSPDPTHSDWTGRLPPGPVHLSSQGSGDLGERLARAAERVIAGGERVIFIGTDCPSMTAERLRAACRKLERKDAVIHPAFDGGYALLGLNRFDPSIFSGIAWSGASVAQETIARIGRLGWSLHLGSTLQDIDEPEDFLRHSRESGNPASFLSAPPQEKRDSRFRGNDEGNRGEP